MSRVITFSTKFPSYHPKAGQPTYFVEKMIQWYWDNISDVLQGYHNVPTMLYALNHSKFSKQFYEDFSNALDPEINEWKSHTIRGGQRFKAGDFFKPCIWTGVPYRSPQMQFLPALQIPNTWDFDAHGTDFFLSGKHEQTHPEGFDFSEVERNDGLGDGELFDWICDSPDFKKTSQFTGQIICWNDSIKY